MPKAAITLAKENYQLCIVNSQLANVSLPKQLSIEYIRFYAIILFIILGAKAMQINKISLKQHFLFGDINIDLVDNNGKPFKTVVFAGNNGCGKTTLLNTIYEILTSEKPSHPESNLVLSLKNIWKDSADNSNDSLEISFSGESNNINKLQSIANDLDEVEEPKIIYLPAEIPFNKTNVKEKPYHYKYSFKNLIDKETIGDVPSYISSIIQDAVFKNQELPAKTSIDKVCREINKVFEGLGVDAKLVGLAAEGPKLPIFENSLGDSFDINALSSGEKQLFLRTLALKMVRANNSIILIDEPESSLHPKWQQKILSVYEQIGENNQIIIATHSPHILSSCKKESCFLLSRENGQIKIQNHEELNSTYGKPVDIVLTDFMGLKSLRTPEIDAKFQDLNEMVRNNESDGEDFKKKMTKLTNIVGEIDEGIILLKMELARKKYLKTNKNA